MEITVTAKRQNTYNIISSDNFDKFYTCFEEMYKDPIKVCVISDENVFNYFGEDFINHFSSKYTVSSFVIKPGEASKSFDSVTKALCFLKENDFSRKDVLVALGGGVVCDLTGFIAALFHRGIDHVMVPTTLLAMADASIGGKNAVDFEGLKNIVGTFKMPSLIYLCLDTLKKLPEREYYAGFSEIMKAGLLADADFYMWLIDNMYEICDKDYEVISEMLQRAIEIKKTIVEKDPFEKGDRALLNLGHSFGHALESYFEGEYIHGEAVALGCVCAAFVSWKLNMIKMEDYYEVRDMFVPFNLPISICVDKKALSEIKGKMLKDKKNSEGKVNLVLLKKIGKAVLVEDVDQNLIMEALEELNFSLED